MSGGGKTTRGRWRGRLQVPMSVPVPRTRSASGGLLVGSGRWMRAHRAPRARLARAAPWSGPEGFIREIYVRVVVRQS